MLKRFFTQLFILTITSIIFMSNNARAQSAFLTQYPHLKKFLYLEPSPHLFLGLGLSPLGLVQSKVYFSANLFQLHFIENNWDFEIFSASIGKTSAQSSSAQSDHFTIRSSPKYKIYGVVSAGPVIGLEFVRFPNLQSRLYKGGWTTPLETFSTSGSFYGLAISENIDIGDHYILKISQLLYKQGYSIKKTHNNWQYLLFDSNSYELEDEEIVAAISPDTVFMLEFSILF
ncbi:MAG: hypothetical protein A2504_17570 [Bdellovibrionales bacterium RIFOXYD12_FULL_39_22]|nr:MAG: hypothetical protein A2385_15270 [Bdellovibrionales bacterium RIFOXYB1_FULL_39_21]OFZ40631.1 MAG: hypothetical protein A2485_03495 [Bdellovibrionales bacterium RIFOXYC12_FULL_39_17]OFZ50421.1 MAG: hypothetical protein A2404_02570 [Bdellovibrionales bacterium RIFOXYC1_FULL_39_130]OFZ77680.1 MAG: hypothetical protein A2560_04940 [Bdellovibrionales bacterium RIFOXYD1_FULL_39_84]OFZ91714.1 MAG: hypothetical protein A2504_17570 [Bdellovibrionales bacterium RIFOXYD12_FULL_39_22]